MYIFYKSNNIIIYSLHKIVIEGKNINVLYFLNMDTIFTLIFIIIKQFFNQKLNTISLIFYKINFFFLYIYFIYVYNCKINHNNSH